MSLKTIPGFGKSGTSRIFAARSIGHSDDSVAQRAPEEELRELLCELGEPVEVLQGALAGLGAPGAQLRHERLQEVGLVPRRGDEPPQVAQVGAGRDQACARRRPRPRRPR